MRNVDLFSHEDYNLSAYLYFLSLEEMQYCGIKWDV